MGSKVKPDLKTESIWESFTFLYVKKDNATDLLVIHCKFARDLYHATETIHAGEICPTQDCRVSQYFGIGIDIDIFFENPRYWYWY